jgi:hypothetical protein
MVGLVRWCRNHPRIKENLSGGVGLVCGMKCGIFERTGQLRNEFAHQCCTTSKLSEGQPSCMYPPSGGSPQRIWSPIFPARFSVSSLEVFDLEVSPQSIGNLAFFEALEVYE